MNEIEIKKRMLDMRVSVKDISVVDGRETSNIDAF